MTEVLPGTSTQFLVGGERETKEQGHVTLCLPVPLLHPFPCFIVQASQDKPKQHGMPHKQVLHWYTLGRGSPAFLLLQPCEEQAKQGGLRPDIYAGQQAMQATSPA